MTWHFPEDWAKRLNPDEDDIGAAAGPYITIDELVKESMKIPERAVLINKARLTVKNYLYGYVPFL